MKLTFKDVGQGDSILLEWKDGDENKIGIIDCNRKYGKNPVLEHLKALGYKKVEFIILSHPHTDHYSGMVEMLNWIAKEGIIIKSFGHTCHLLASDYYKYLNAAVPDTQAKGDLQKLFFKVDELAGSGIIKKIDFIVEGTVRDITSEVKMKCLSPSKSEAEIYMKDVDLEPVKNTTKASASANHLSTMFKISVGDNYYLLTSDSEAITFKRIMTEDIHVGLRNKNLIVAQVPHHGASVNHYGPFWNYVTCSTKPQAAISAGLHETYKHPHLPVLKAFQAQGYDIHCTNIVYGMIEFADYLKEVAELTDKLDTFTEVVASNTGGDKVFEIS
jgi:beta-lactamase superfamily II metal-dependent hydrolase